MKTEAETGVVSGATRSWRRQGRVLPSSLWVERGPGTSRSQTLDSITGGQ